MTTEELARYGVERFQGQSDWRHPDCPFRHRTADGEWFYRWRLPQEFIAYKRAQLRS